MPMPHSYGTSRDHVRERERDVRIQQQQQQRELMPASALQVRRRPGPLPLDAAPAIRKRLSRSCDHLVEIGLSPRLPPIRRRPTKYGFIPRTAALLKDNKQRMNEF
ncbi:hypothetical protein WR25_00766 [Diploscapter pachys]|uniref:Uncharacterized protein n=1 Tax=Diploscapter pachys TaxID=2018661 RepID=A0A2A2LEM2_9BILA|nr:hypothetical protein WR25_00766 [Diploscapter pachys]